MRASVSNIDLFRCWKQEEDLGAAWLLDRILGRVDQTPKMRAGEMFHKALEFAPAGVLDKLEFDKYTFHIPADCEIEFASIKEVSLSEEYGELLVRGRIDAVIGNTVIDHKTTERFDADRLMEGYQWRFYLDMLKAQKFRWNVFVLRETDDLFIYEVLEMHVLEQATYPAIHDDCLKLAREYAQIVTPMLERAAEASLYIQGDEMEPVSRG